MSQKPFASLARKVICGMVFTVVIFAATFGEGNLPKVNAQSPGTSTSTSEITSSPIFLIPGTVSVKKAIEDAIVDALEDANSVIPSGVLYFAITDVREVSNWAIISVVGFIEFDENTDWSLEDGAWFGIVLLHNDGQDIWSGATQGTVEFSNLLQSVPNDILDTTAKKNLDPLSLPDIEQQSNYTFPWQPGTNMFYGSKGVHDNGFATIVNGWKAVDFLSDGDTGAGHAPNRLLASETATISYVCNDGVSVAVKMGNFFYTHLLYNSNLYVGKTFSQGNEMGQMKPGTFQANCGYANQDPNWFHVHWGFPNADLSVENWTLSISTQNWTNGSNTVSPGNGWILAGGGNSGSCTPTADQVALYVDANYSGTCVVKGIGDYPNPSSLGIANDSISSVKVGSNVKLTLCRDDNYGGTCETFQGDDANLSDNSIGNDQASSAKVQSRSGGSCGITSIPSGYNQCAEEDGFCSFSGTANVIYGANSCYTSPRSFSNGTACNNNVFGDPLPGVRKYCYTNGTTGGSWAYQLFDLGDYNGDKYESNQTITNLSTVGWNDRAESIKINSGYEIIACEHADFQGNCGRVTGPAQFSDINALAQGLRNGLSSIKVCAGSCPNPPAAPSLISPSNGQYFNEGESITLSWTATGSEYYGEIWGGPGGTLTFGWQSGSSKNIGSQWAGYTYSWHVKAKNNVGESGWSSTWNFTIRPGAPTNLNASAVSCSQINLSWNDNSGNEEGYKIYRNGNLIATLGSGVTSYQNTGLSGNTTYSYSVKAYRGSIESNASNTVTVTTPSCQIPPPTPTNFRVASTTTNSITLAWNDVSGETGYKIYKWGYDGSQWKFLYYASVGANVTTYTDNNLPCGNDFNFYELSAYNSYGESNHTGWIQGITNACPPPANDDFSAPKVISQIPYTDTLLTTGATAASDDPPFTACNRQPGLATVWYRYVPASSGGVQIDTFGSDYDTLLGVWTGSRGSLTLIGCNDDSESTYQSKVRVSLTAGTTYYIEVAEYNGELSSMAQQSVKESLSAQENELPPGAGSVSTQSVGGTLKLNVGPTDLTPPSVLSITRANANPTSAASVNFTVTFSEAVTGVDTSDFRLTVSGISGASVTSVSGSGASRTVTVNTGTGNGTLRLDVADNDSILDAASNPLGDAGANNGNFTSGQVYDVVKSSDLLSPANGVFLLDRRPNFDWTDFAGASSYQLQVARNNTFTLGLVSATSLSSQYAWPTDLLPNTTHYWRVRAKVGAVYTAWSNTWSFTTANPPSIPVLVAPANNALTTDYTPKLDWSNVTVPLGVTFDHYQLQVATDAAFTSIVLDKSDLVNLTDSEFTFPADLRDNTTFYWRVRSFNSLGQYSGWSLTRTFRTALLPPIPTLPANGEIVLSNPRPTFDWSDIAGATTYSLQVSRDSTFSKLLINALATTSAYTPVVNLPLNVTLYWRVRSNGTNGPSMWSTTNTFIIQ